MPRISRKRQISRKNKNKNKNKNNLEKSIESEIKKVQGNHREDGL